MKFIYINILLFHGFPWNSPAVPWNSMELFHGIPWNIKSSMELDTNTKCHGIPWNPRTFKKKVPWNSMEFDKWHGTWLHHQIPWNPQTQVINSKEFQGTMNVSWNLKWSEIPWNSIEYSVQFHGTLVPSNTISPSSMEFQGLYSLRRRRLTGIGIPIIYLRRSDDRRRFIMGIPILIRRRLLSE